MRNIILLISLMGILNSTSVIAEMGFGASEPGHLTSRAPITPTPLSPLDGSIILEDSISVIWYHTPHTSAYSLQTSLFTDFSILLEDVTGLVDTLYSFSTVENDTLYWRVSSFNIAGESGPSEVWSISTVGPVATRARIDVHPETFDLLPPYPNPFNPTTMLRYHLPEVASVSLMIYNNLGQEITRLVSDQQQAGRYGVIWDGKNSHGVTVASGVYICHLIAGDQTFTQKILLIR